MSATVSPVIGEATVQELREAVRGEVIAPGDEGYAEACRIWNGMYDGRRPAVIVRCAGVADVIAAVGFARSNDLPLAVRGGGHSVAGFSSCDDGLVIDLGDMREVRVDLEDGVAHVGGGAVWADVDHETQAHGLATTGGLVSITGVGGFTLGGGIGWLMRKHGLALDNLVGADVVTADGQLVRASADENPELFWGLRGGGGNFGIVTQFDLELHPVGPIVHAGPVFYAPEQARALLRLFRDWAPGAPDDVTALVNLTTAPPLPVIPEEWHGKKVVAFIACSTGPVERGRCARAALPRAGRADRRPARPDAVQRAPDAARPALGQGHPLVLQGGEPRVARRRADRQPRGAARRRFRGRRPRSTCTRWAAPSGACPRTRPRSRSARCRSSSTA